MMGKKRFFDVDKILYDGYSYQRASDSVIKFEKSGPDFLKIKDVGLYWLSRESLWINEFIYKFMGQVESLCEYINLSLKYDFHLFPWPWTYIPKFNNFKIMIDIVTKCDDDWSSDVNAKFSTNKQWQT